MLLLGIAGPAADPAETGEKFVGQMRAKARIEPETTRRASLGDFPIFIVTYLDRSGRAPTYLHFAWVAMAGNTYQLIGLAPERHWETLRKAALTLRPLTPVERACGNWQAPAHRDRTPRRAPRDPRRPHRQRVVPGLHRPGQRARR